MAVQKLLSPSFGFPVALLCLLFFFSLIGSPVEALTNPQRYYDWGPYYSESEPKVLGVSVTPEQPQSSPPAQFRGVQDVAQFKGYFLGFGSGLNPGNPLYFLKKAQESLVLGLTFDPAKKNDLQFQIAGGRLAELEKLAQGGQTQLIAGSSADYQKAMATATSVLSRLNYNSTESQDRLKQFNEESAKHSLVLEQVLAKSSPSNKAGLSQALAASDKISDTVSDLSGKAALPLEVLDRIQALKSQGLLSPEEAQKLVSLTSRVEARVELQKFANEGIFPRADINKLDELAKTKYAQTYNQVVELKKLQELKKFEGEKPSPEILNKVQDFAKNYKAGDQVPPDLRRYWAPLVRLEELQNTIRPDLIDENALKSQTEDYKKYQEVVARLKPRPEDLAQVEKLVGQNPNAANDPFYQRVMNLAGKFGTGESGTQVPGIPTATKSCPGNSHWVGVPYMPDGGYCVPNITYVTYQSQSAEGENKTPAASESICPTKYHRNYASGPCVPDAYFGSPVNYPTYTPGGYPSPVFPPAGCPSGYVWTGSACMSPGFSPDSPRPGDNPQSMTPSRESQETACRSGGGTCVSWVNGACGCERSGQTTGTSGSSGSSNAGVCPIGQYRNNNGACVSAGPTGGTSGGSCSQGQYWNGNVCVSSSSGSGSPSRESQEAACRSGGGTCVSWVNGACGCERSSGSGVGAHTSGGTSPTPPSGYGTCTSGQYWNGGSCVSNTYTPPVSAESPEVACTRGGGCSWTGSACNCPSSPGPSSTPAPAPAPSPTPTPPPPSPSPSPEPPHTEPGPSTYTPPTTP